MIMKRARLIFHELKNYFFLLRVLNKESRKTGPDSLWIRYNLRKNRFGRVYTVISLREEEMGEEEMVRNWMAMERMRPINEYLTDIGLHEIIFPSIEHIPDSRSYLVVYSPLLEETKFSWFFWRILFLTGLSFLAIFLKNYF